MDTTIIMATFAVGQAPWETGANNPQTPAGNAPQTFPVGKAPWEVPQEPTAPPAQTPQSNSPSVTFNPLSIPNLSNINQQNTTPQGVMNKLTAPLQTSGNGFNYAKDIVGLPTGEPGFAGSIFQSTVGSKGLAGVAQLPGKVIAGISEYAPIIGKHQAEGLYNQASNLSTQSVKFFKMARDETDPTTKQKYIDIATQLNSSAQDLISHGEDIQSRTDMTPGQALGTGLNAAITAITAGTGPLIDVAAAPGSGLVTKAAVLGLRGLENAGIGVGYNTASNLENSNNITKGDLGAGILGSLVPALPAGASKLGETLGVTGAEGMINSLIKPLGKDFAYGKNPAAGILREGITANSFGELSDKVNQKLSEVGQEIGNVGRKIDETTSQRIEQSGESKISQAQSGNKTFDLQPALKPLDDAMQTAVKTNNPTLLNSLNNVKIALTHDLKLDYSESGTPIISKGGLKNLTNNTYADGVKFLADVRDHTKFTGNPSDDRLLNSATKQVYGQARQLMNEHAATVDPALGAQIKSLNERYSDLSSAKSAIDHRDLVLKRANMVGLVGKLGAMGGVASALTVGLTTGNWGTVAKIIIATAGGEAALKAGESTPVITRVAQLLSKLAPEERQGILNTSPVLKNYWQRITGKELPSENAPQTRSLKAVNTVKNTILK